MPKVINPFYFPVMALIGLRNHRMLFHPDMLLFLPVPVLTQLLIKQTNLLAYKTGYAYQSGFPVCFYGKQAAAYRFYFVDNQLKTYRLQKVQFE